MKAITMKYIFWILLALMCLGILAANQLSKANTFPDNLTPTTETNSTDSTEVDGLRFEILIPEREWIIPENKEGASTPLKLGLRITNQTATTVRLSAFNPIIVVNINILTLDGNRLPSEAFSGGPMIGNIEEAACPLIKPGESFTFFLDGKLFWQEDQLVVGGSGLWGKWYHEIPRPGTYRVQFAYSGKFTTCYEKDPSDPEEYIVEITDQLWFGKAMTPFVEVYIVKPE